MYRAFVFDLDGTLVQTEKLKAISYARAARALAGDRIHEDDVVQAFKEVVGQSRREVSEHLMRAFELEEPARARMEGLEANRPWQAFTRLRLDEYERLIGDPETIREHRWPHTLALLEEARSAGCKTGLATTSRRRQASTVLESLHLLDRFDFVATSDDVDRDKPDPEIYHLVAEELDVRSSECLVIEDSPPGVKAARAANMDVIAVATPFTRSALHEGAVLEPRWIVDDPERLVDVVRSRIAARGGRGGG